jgi:hypothetical protein
MSLKISFFQTMKITYLIPKNIVIDADANDETIVTQSGTLLCNNTTHNVIGRDKIIRIVTRA